MDQATCKNLDQLTDEEVQDYWLQCIRHWYPELHSLTYFLPPLHFNRVAYGVTTFHGERVLVPKPVESGATQQHATSQMIARATSQMTAVPTTKSYKANTFLSLWPEPCNDLDLKPVQDSDVRDDRALQRVLYCLRALADSSQPEEVMMVISQLQFGKYLHHPSYAAACHSLPRPCTLPEDFLKHHYDQGDFDVFIISREHGLITFEIKSVGENFSQLNLTKQQEDDIVLKKVGEAVIQLHKAQIVLQHLTSDLRNLKVTKCLVLPNINKEQLSRLLKRSSINGQDLCYVLGVINVDDAVNRCLLSDDLSDKYTPWCITREVLENLQEWWQLLANSSGCHSGLTEAEYENLVARFCGPATSVEMYCVTAPRLALRTLGEVVSETGETMARLVLFPQQINLLNMSPPRVFLSGPPGTGKTVVLVLQGLSWLRRGHDVHLVSTWSGSTAVTVVIKHQLQKSMKSSAINSYVFMNTYSFYTDEEVESAVKYLECENEGRQLCVIADEAGPDREFFGKFCGLLIQYVPRVYMWSASVSNNIKPFGLQEVKLTIPLRSPPVVIRELVKADEIKSREVYNYTKSGVPCPTDGPAIIWINHQGQSSHTEYRPYDCFTCGIELVRVLRQLHVGQPGVPNGPPPLHYRDVLMLLDDYPDVLWVKNGDRLVPVLSKMVECLLYYDIPVHLVQRHDTTAIRDMGLGISDRLMVTSWECVHGLERKVIIVENYGLGFSDRLYTMSRCSSQLVLIN